MRRNWPDLLIGIALVAVIAGIIATLLTGGSFFPLGQQDQTAGRQSSSQSTAARGPDSSDSAARSTSSATSGTSAAGGNDSTTRTGDVGSVGEERPGSEEPRTEQGAEASRSRSVEVTALPLPGTPSANSVPSTGTESVTITAPVSDAPVAASAEEERQSAPVSAPGPAERAAGDEGLYRVAVGAFGARENAERQADTFRQAGYPVFIGAQGDLSIVLVGPYDALSEAERVAERIRAGDHQVEPVIYRFRADGERASSGTTASTSGPAAPREAESAATANTASEQTATAAAQPTASQASGARYLQVGAYGSSASAMPQRQRLENLGYRVTERTEGNLIKLLVGPFAGEELTAARGRLSEQGIDHFPR